MKKMALLTSFLLATSLSSAAFADKEGTKICKEVVQKLIRKNALSTVELIEKLKTEKRISDFDLKEFDRIKLPANEILNAVVNTCIAKDLDKEQAQEIANLLIDSQSNDKVK